MPPEGTTSVSHKIEAAPLFRDRFRLRLTPRRGMIAALAVVLLAGTALGVSRFMMAAPEAPKPDHAALTVTVGPVETRRMAETLQVNGSLVPWEDLAIGTESTGLSIVRILADEGDHVTAGQLLAKLDDAIILAQLKENQAQIEHARATIGQQDAAIAEAEANVKSASHDLLRAQELMKTNSITLQTTEQREAIARTADARLNSARMGRAVSQADLTVAEATRTELMARFAQTEIRAPADGIVSKRTARIGNIVIGAGNDVLFRMVRDGILELDANVPDRMMARLAAGQRVRLAAIGSDGKLIFGTVRAVAPLVDPTTRMGIAHIRFPIEAALRAGMFVSGDLMLEERDTVAVPESSILVKDGKPVVFALAEGNLVTEKPVETGLRMDGRVAILKGLEPGDQIVHAGAGFLKDGDKVRVGEGS
ncbi:MAG: HlyD family secretion protein [Rhodospirillales bacterium]|nr:HlyD family secretion protein [Rhodospirillales bacterium]